MVHQQFHAFSDNFQFGPDGAPAMGVDQNRWCDRCGEWRHVHGGVQEEGGASCLVIDGSFGNDGISRVSMSNVGVSKNRVPQNGWFIMENPIF